MNIKTDIRKEMESPKLQNWLSILALAIGVGSAWAAFSNRMGIAEKEIEHVQADVEEVQLEQRELSIQRQAAAIERNNLRNDLKIMKKDVSHVKSAVDDVKDILTNQN